MRHVKFPTYTCVGAQLVCDSRGYDYVSCRDDASSSPHSSEVTCLAPTTGESFTRTVLSGVVGAAVGAGVGYAVHGEKGMLPAAAMCGALGLIFGNYV
jgi:hypothetical protein